MFRRSNALGCGRNDKRWRRRQRRRRNGRKRRRGRLRTGMPRWRTPRTRSTTSGRAFLVCGGVGEFGRVDLTVEDEGWGGDERGLFRLCRALPTGAWTLSSFSSTPSQLTAATVCPQSILCPIYVAVTPYRFRNCISRVPSILFAAESFGEVRVQCQKGKQPLAIERV